MSAELAERILAREVHRFGSGVPGYDSEDLRQEARIALWLHPPDMARRGAKSYIRTVVRHRLSAILRQETTDARCPKDPWGHAQIRPSGVDLDTMPAPAPAPEAELDLRRAVTYLRGRLDSRDWRALLEAVQVGDDVRDPAVLADARVRAGRILSRMGYRVSRERSSSMYPQPDDKTSLCHPSRGGEGYNPDPEEPCHGCRDKFTCLPQAIERGLVQLTRKADLEVDAVLDGRLSYADAVARIQRRLAKQARGELLLPEDRITWTMLDDAPAAALPEPAAPPPLEAAPQIEEPAAPLEEPEESPPRAAEEDAEMAMASKLPEGIRVNGEAVYRGSTKIGLVRKSRPGWGWYRGKEESRSWYGSKIDAVVALVRSSERKAVQPERPKAKPAKKVRAVGKSEAPRPASWPVMSNGKPLPVPKKLSEEEMQAVLRDTQAKLGANIQLEYGMEIVRRKRDGEVVATITPTGFVFDVPAELVKQAGLASSRQTFGSLSSVAMWAELRMVSGNDFFNLAAHSCTEIRSKSGRIIDRRGGIGRR